MLVCPICRTCDHIIAYDPDQDRVLWLVLFVILYVTLIAMVVYIIYLAITME